MTGRRSVVFLVLTMVNLGLTIMSAAAGRYLFALLPSTVVVLIVGAVSRSAVAAMDGWLESIEAHGRRDEHGQELERRFGELEQALRACGPWNAADGWSIVGEMGPEIVRKNGRSS